MATQKAKNPFMATKKFVSKISGAEYTFQKVAPRPWLKIMDEYSRSGESNEKLADLAFEHLIVEPRLTVDDFEDFAEVEEVTQAAVRFQRGQ